MTEISVITTDLSKEIYKKVFSGEQVKINNNVDNKNDKSIYDQFFNMQTRLAYLKLIFTINIVFNFISIHLLDILSFNNYSKTICKDIYLLLILNRLQYLIIEKILNHANKNKRKMYFDLS